MLKSILFIFSSVLFIGLGHADPLYRLFEAKQFAKYELMTLSGGPPATVSNGIYDQKLDHLSSVDTRQFKQRYFYSSSMAKNKMSPVLIYICGEGACSGGALNGVLASHARKVGAHMFAIEHRYYGQTQPFADLSTENLKYLSTEQALLDLVQFKNDIQKKMGLMGPWLAVGGSYAGNLSAYLRSQYPQEFAGALASSAPVQPDLNFTEYDRHVAKMAGPACARATNSILREIEMQIQTDEGFKSAQRTFMAESVSRRDDFLYLLSDITSASIQYGIGDDFCKAIETKGVAGYVEMKLKVDKMFGDFSDYTAEQAENISLQKHSGPLGMRQWFYQSCTEYGYWQNSNAEADPALSMRSSVINPAYHDELCHRLFGMEKAGSVQPLLQKYYLPLLDSKITSRILFTNGATDPWSNLSINAVNSNDGNSLTETIMMPSGFHCSDLSTGGPPDVMQTKARFQTLLSLWVQ